VPHPVFSAWSALWGFGQRSGDDNRQDAATQEFPAALAALSVPDFASEVERGGCAASGCGATGAHRPGRGLKVGRRQGLRVVAIGVAHGDGSARMRHASWAIRSVP
jgi:hypothetical protein